MSGPEDEDSATGNRIPDAPVYADPAFGSATPEPDTDTTVKTKKTGKPKTTAKPTKIPKTRSPRAPGKRSWLARILVFFLVVGLVIPVGLTGVYRFVPPPVTYLMLQRVAEGRGLDKHWRPLTKINPVMVQAVVASEDSHFCSHHGFDVDAIKKAMANNERRPTRIKGGSTISQQTAKNVFLWPGRSYLRKGLEAYFTVLIEALWGKRRIMEVYLNVAEWGPGTYGVEAAAQRYFKVPASKLSRAQAARLAAVLPNPIRYKAANPGKYVAGRSRRIGAASVTVREDQLAACVVR